MRENIQTADLVDIRDVAVDKNLPQRERLLEFVRQIKDPYKYKCGRFIISCKYNENKDAPTFEQCLGGLIA